MVTLIAFLAIGTLNTGWADNPAPDPVRVASSAWTAEEFERKPLPSRYRKPAPRVAKVTRTSFTETPAPARVYASAQSPPVTASPVAYAVPAAPVAQYAYSAAPTYYAASYAAPGGFLAADPFGACANGSCGAASAYSGDGSTYGYAMPRRGLFRGGGLFGGRGLFGAR